MNQEQKKSRFVMVFNFYFYFLSEKKLITTLLSFLRAYCTKMAIFPVFNQCVSGKSRKTKKLKSISKKYHFQRKKDFQLPMEVLAALGITYLNKATRQNKRMHFVVSNVQLSSSGLAVLFRRQLLNGSQDFFFVLMFNFHLFFKYKTIFAT